MVSLSVSGCGGGWGGLKEKCNVFNEEFMGVLLGQSYSKGWKLPSGVITMRVFICSAELLQIAESETTGSDLEAGR